MKKNSSNAKQRKEHNAPLSSQHSLRLSLYTTFIKKGGEEMLRKKLLVPLSAIVLTSGTLFVVPPAHAQTQTPEAHANLFDGLVQFISQKFGLDKNQVQSAVTEYHKQQKANSRPRPTLSEDQVKTMEKNRLDKLVSQGKITAAQEQAILDELASLRSKYNLNDMKNLTPEERHKQMQSFANDVKSWAQSQGIDPSYVMPFLGMEGGKRGMRGHMGNWGNKPPLSTVTPSPSQ